MNGPHEVIVTEGADLDAMLADFNIDDLTEIEASAEEFVEEVIKEPADLDPAAIDMLAVDLTRGEIYAESESDGTVEELVEPEASEEVAAAPIKAKKVRAAGVPKKPAIERDLSALPDEAFRTSTLTAPDRAVLMAQRPSQKKITEKFDQTIIALAAGRKPSCYVMDCFAILDAKKTVTSAELVAALLSMKVKSGERNYSDGTARSQVGQIMVLFQVLGIAGRIGQSLNLLSHSRFAEHLRALA